MRYGPENPGRSLLQVFAAVPGENPPPWKFGFGNLRLLAIDRPIAPGEVIDEQQGREYVVHVASSGRGRLNG